jgi:hypothetical protein
MITAAACRTNVSCGKPHSSCCGSPQCDKPHERMIAAAASRTNVCCGKPHEFTLRQAALNAMRQAARAHVHCCGKPHERMLRRAFRIHVAASRTERHAASRTNA